MSKEISSKAATDSRTVASDLDAFTRAYIECALWASTDGNDNPLDANYSVTDLSPETLASIKNTCKAFQRDNETPDYHNGQYSNEELAGHDFWLTRNGHGSGFWDGDLDKATGEKLTEAAHAYGECDLYVGDDGKLYI
jgi:hypothetical protein